MVNRRGFFGVVAALCAGGVSPPKVVTIGPIKCVDSHSVRDFVLYHHNPDETLSVTLNGQPADVWRDGWR